LLDIMYELPSMNDVSKVILDADAIKGKTEPLLMYEGKDRVASD